MQAVFIQPLQQLPALIVYQRNNIMESLKGKYILIAGATGTIGAALVKQLSASGAHLFLLGRNAGKLSSLEQSCKPGQVASYVCDITDLNHVQEMKAAYFNQYPAIDILINVAGIGIIKTMDQLTEDEFMQTIRINLYAPFLLVKAFLPAMKEVKKGLIIQVPGVLGKTPMAGAAAYAASKYGLNGMMQSIREEIKRTDIRITNLFLGGADTAFWDNIDLRVQRDKMIQAEEAARAIWFLCQQPASGVINEMVLQPFNHQAI